MVGRAIPVLLQVLMITHGVMLNIHVQNQISNQFKSAEFAQHYAVIISVIDTTIKNSMNVF